MTGLTKPSSRPGKRYALIISDVDRIIRKLPFMLMEGSRDGLIPPDSARILSRTIDGETVTLHFRVRRDAIRDETIYSVSSGISTLEFFEFACVATMNGEMQVRGIDERMLFLAHRTLKAFEPVLRSRMARYIEGAMWDIIHKQENAE